MRKSLDFTKQFNKLVDESEDYLFNQKKIEFVHVGYSSNEMKKAFEQNNKQMSLLDNEDNIYALWSMEYGGDWNLKYIGQRKRGSLKQRIREHLFFKHEKTGSQLKNVQKEVENGKIIGVTVIGVLPDELRSAVEESLISRKRNTVNLWNIHSNGK